MAKTVSKNNKKAKKVEPSTSTAEESPEEYSNTQIEQAEAALKDLSVSSESEVESAEEKVANEEDCNDKSDAEESTASGSKSAEEEDNETARTIFIKDLDYDVREEDIKKQMVRLGNVVRVTVPMSYDFKRNKGFAYVEFKTVEEATKALKLNGTELLGRKVMVCQAKPKENKNIFTVFCKNLSYNTTKEELKEHFEQYGKVFNVSLPIDSENPERNKGFCFIEYTEYETVEKVLKAKHTVNERLLYLNEGNKNEERNEKRSGDRLYGRRGEQNFGDRSNDRREGGRFNDRREGGRFNDRREGGRFNDRREGGRFNDRREGGRSNDRRESSFRKGNDSDRRQNRGGKSENKKVFDDSD